MPNNFAAADRAFINKLAEDLHLYVTWDEYDEEDELQNIVTWRFPGELEQPVPEDGAEAPNGSGTPAEDDENDEAWEDEDDEESKAAVDRVLAKYSKAKVSEPDQEGDFDARYELSVQEKMNEWKRGYYKVPIRLCRSFLILT